MPRAYPGEFRRRVQSGQVELTMKAALNACELTNRMERQATADERAEQSERFGVASLLTALDGLLDVVHDVAGDDAWVEVIDRASRDVLDFERWSYHPRLAKRMAENRRVDEGRTPRIGMSCASAGQRSHTSRTPLPASTTPTQNASPKGSRTG